MPKVAEYTLEFKDRAVRLVVAERGPDESRSAACERLAAKLGVKPVTLYGWVKKALQQVSTYPHRSVFQHRCCRRNGCCRVLVRAGESRSTRGMIVGSSPRNAPQTALVTGCAVYF